MLVLCACGASTTGPTGDRLCSNDAGCAEGLVCAHVLEVRVGTRCLASSGADVCRPVCTTCPPSNGCGCVCP